MKIQDMNASQLVDYMEPIAEALQTIEEPIQLTAQQRFSEGLRELADFYDAHPEVKAPYTGTNFTIFGITKEDLPIYARAFGKAEKCFDAYSFQLSKSFGYEMKLRTYSSREEVCERVKIGEKVVPAHTIPAQEEKFVEEEVEAVFEWKCPDAILKPQVEEKEVAEVEVEDGDGIPF